MKSSWYSSIEAHLIKVIYYLMAEFDSNIAIVFGSLSRREVLPGSDLDLVIPTPHTDSFLYKPTIIEGRLVDLNLVRFDYFETWLEQNWYWRELLRNRRVFGHDSYILDSMEAVYSRLNNATRLKQLTAGWVNISEAHYSNFCNARGKWYANQLLFLSITSLSNGILQIQNKIPHSYHIHIRQISDEIKNIDLLNEYLSFITFSPFMPSSIVSSLCNNTNDDSAIEFKAKAIRERIFYLESLERLSDSIVYSKYMFWSFLVRQASNYLGVKVPAQRENYYKLIAAFDDKIPVDLKLFYTHSNRTTMELTDLREQLKKELLSKGTL